jgi:hypothetical protein
MGATIDLKNRVAMMGSSDAEQEAFLMKELQEGHELCMTAFNQGDTDSIQRCLDPQVALFSGSSEIRGREAVIEYIQQKYFTAKPPAHFEMRVRDSRFLGDAVWFGYDLTITMPKGSLTAEGMAICRRSNGDWQLLNMHNSFEHRR